MNFFKELSHEVKIILLGLGSCLVPLLGSKELLTTLITKPFRESIPEILPVLVATGLSGGGLANMTLKKTDVPK